MLVILYFDDAKQSSDWPLHFSTIARKRTRTTARKPAPLARLRFRIAREVIAKEIDIVDREKSYVDLRLRRACRSQAAWNHQLH